jgi:hypothetical protein
MLLWGIFRGFDKADDHCGLVDRDRDPGFLVRAKHAERGLMTLLILLKDWLPTANELDSKILWCAVSSKQ